MNLRDRGMKHNVLWGALCGVCIVIGKIDKNILIGHRGASSLAPENTLSSFEKALDFGVDMIELDVHCCKSGELVVFHDYTVERMTDGVGYIVDKTLTQLKMLTIKNKEQIPTLQEVLNLVNRRCKINIELKGEHTGKAVAIFLKDFLKKNWQHGDFLVTSFNFYELYDFNRELPEVPIGIIFGCLPIDYSLFAKQFGAQAIMM